jgi:hypothetical protein
VCILPITSVGLNHTASHERISTGLERLDNILSGSGYYRGSSALVSGTAGTGKSSLAAIFVDAACKRGERAIYFCGQVHVGRGPDLVDRHAREKRSDYLRRYTGGGISQPLLAQIFDLFVQVNRSLDRSQGGLGLGLTIVKRVVEMHGGRIETRNKGIGKGSECLVWLPLLEQVCAA